MHANKGVLCFWPEPSTASMYRYQLITKRDSPVIGYSRQLIFLLSSGLICLIIFCAYSVTYFLDDSSWRDLASLTAAELAETPLRVSLADAYRDSHSGKRIPPCAVHAA